MSVNICIKDTELKKDVFNMFFAIMEDKCILNSVIYSNR